jgi:hypothetical protein
MHLTEKGFVGLGFSFEIIVTNKYRVFQTPSENDYYQWVTALRGTSTESLFVAVTVSVNVNVTVTVAMAVPYAV